MYTSHNTLINDKILISYCGLYAQFLLCSQSENIKGLRVHKDYFKNITFYLNKQFV